MRIRYFLGHIARFTKARMEEVPLMTFGRSDSVLTDPNDNFRVVTEGCGSKHASNAVSNAKYSVFTFVPCILYEQFKFFFNLYFLLVALSQAYPPLRIGYLSSYIVPLAFVLVVTMGKEAWDDLKRRKRDRESNMEQYELVTGKYRASQDLQVGDIIHVQLNQRVPADILILKSSEPTGETFIRTDQLDGETDWKLRQAVMLTQNADFEDLRVVCGPPAKLISEFQGTLAVSGREVAVSVENTMWANTVVAAGNVAGIVLYTGKDTRMAKNTNRSRSKVCLLELEVNTISKFLCLSVLILSLVLVFLNKSATDETHWLLQTVRFLILFSTIIPVSLRVNLDMAKSFYAYQIEHDRSIPSTVVRTSTIPEDLGRIDFLMTDKTGTITQNDMDLRKIHVGQVAFGVDSMQDVKQFIAESPAFDARNATSAVGESVGRLAWCLALCHSVTPTQDGAFQAVSPDEIAIVSWLAHVGLELVKRDRYKLVIKHTASNSLHEFRILYTFPFNSDSKRMSIVVQSTVSEKTWFLVKGADAAIAPLVKHNDWLDEEVSNMAREGLRTLVVAEKQLDPQLLEEFVTEFAETSLQMGDTAPVVQKHLETGLDLLGVTGVEDKLQPDIKPSFELLRNAQIKIWMLTGDKVETARCVAVSSRLVGRGQYIHTVTNLDSVHRARQHLDYLASKPSCLLIDGRSLQFLMRELLDEFAEVALQLASVIACRCTPQQKADLVNMVKLKSGKRVAAIGDGGNDVSMIQAADVGLGIVGKEGKQASLAADFSVTLFWHITKLMLWHGRNSYKRSAKLAQVVIHRGLIISVCQAVYSISSRFEPIALFKGWLMVGYATLYTMMPVFSLVTDHDIPEHLTRMYPELYAELKDGRSLSARSFGAWLVTSLFQGAYIQGLAQFLIGPASVDTLFTYLVMVAYTSLIFTELLMVAEEIITWNLAVLFSEIASLGAYLVSFPFLNEYFDLQKLRKPAFYGIVAVLVLGAVIPPYIAKSVNRRLKPPSYAKVQV